MTSPPFSALVHAARFVPLRPLDQALGAADTVLGRTVDVVQMHPDPSALPGGQVLQNLMNGLQSWALALALVGLVIGAAAWALGSHGQNYQQSFVGRRAVLISGLAALLIGAGPGIVSFFYNAGSGVH
jgi:MFS family permease